MKTIQYVAFGLVTVLFASSSYANWPVGAALFSAMGCAPEGLTENGNTPIDAQDITPPTIQVSIPELFEQRNAIEIRGQTGFVRNVCDGVVLPIEITSDDPNAKIDIFVGNYNDFEGWIRSDGDNISNQNLSIVVDSKDPATKDDDILAYIVEGGFLETKTPGKWLWTYELLNDSLRDDIFWTLPFYVVATDANGNVSISKPIIFENESNGECYGN